MIIKINLETNEVTISNEKVVHHQPTQSKPSGRTYRQAQARFPRRETTQPSLSRIANDKLSSVEVKTSDSIAASVVPSQSAQQHFVGNRNVSPELHKEYEKRLHGGRKLKATDSQSEMEGVGALAPYSKVTSQSEPYSYPEIVLNDEVVGQQPYSNEEFQQKLLESSLLPTDFEEFRRAIAKHLFPTTK